MYNIHGLVHLSEDVKIHGNLDLIFPYENFLGKFFKKNGSGAMQSIESGDTQIIRDGKWQLQS